MRPDPECDRLREMLGGDHPVTLLSIRLPPMFGLADRGRRSHIDAGLKPVLEEA
jgi:hypothetical protein